LALVLAEVTMAQTPPPKPALKLKKLDVFVGSWTLDGTMKPERWARAGQ